MNKKRNSLRNMLSRIALVAVLCMTLASTVFIQAPIVLADPTYTLITGTLPDDGTPWAVITPDPLTNWNGTIILDLDGNSVRTSLSSTVKWLLTNGFAYGGTNRSPVGYDFKKAVDHLLVVRDAFIAHYGETPWRTIAWGSSRGAFVVRKCMEYYPNIFDAGFMSSGGGAGEIATLNAKVDAKFVLKTLVNPASPATIVGIQNTPAAIAAETAAENALVILADSTPQGRARLALAAAVQQFPRWVINGTEEPAPNDYDGQYAQVLKGFGGTLFVSGFAAIEQLGGGIVSWNNDSNYKNLLARSGRQDFVQAMYDKAGLGRAGLEADLRILEKEPRISANPTAVAKAEKLTSYTGDIHGPIMNVDNIGDGLDFPPMKIAYEETVRRAGNNKLLQIVWVHRAAHGNISDLEKITGFVTLLNRLETGKWGDTSLKGMEALADRILAESTITLNPTTTFTEYFTHKFLRTWDGSNWDTYQP